MRQAPVGARAGRGGGEHGERDGESPARENRDDEQPPGPPAQTHKRPAEQPARERRLHEAPVPRPAVARGGDEGPEELEPGEPGRDDDCPGERVRPQPRTGEEGPPARAQPGERAAHRERRREAEPAQQDGGDGRDYLDAGAGDDHLRGGRGDDTLYGLSGVDHLQGDDDADYLEGGTGTDHLDGGTGNDALSGGRDDDTLRGGTGDDHVYTGHGRDDTDGGAGHDTTYGQAEDLSRGVEQAVRVDVSEAGSYIKIEGSPDFVERVQADLDMLRASPRGQMMLGTLEQSHEDSKHWFHDGNGLTIRETAVENSFAFDGERTFRHDHPSVEYNPSIDTVWNGPPVAIFYHELAHVYDYELDTTVEGRYNGQSGTDQMPDGDQMVSVPNRERQAVGLPIDHDGDPHTPNQVDVNHPIEYTENGLRRELGIDDRPRYGEL